ncbi:MAG TPA: DMT family transporter [Rhizomicrobium sp.]|jgi:drug/metabolite transporter (DMT)-like permease|nr:DMT family transporter [Rhizomicrobium sp.]
MQHTSRGIALKIGATLAFSLQYVALKLAGNVPVGEVVFFRAFFALIPLFAFAHFTIGFRETVRTDRPWLHLVRAAIGSSSMFLGFAALKLLPLADITAFGFVQPIFAVVLAALVLKEHVGPYRLAAVAVGFAGVILMIQPHGGVAGILSHGLSAGAGLALTAALCSAFVVIFIRQMSATEKGETIVFYFMSFCAALGAVTMIWWRVPLSLGATVALILGGICGGFGQIMMTFCYRDAEPSLLAPFDYTAMIWAVLFGFMVFAEVPAVMVLAGAAVVTAAGVFIAVREHRIGRELASQVESLPAP